MQLSSVFPINTGSEDIPKQPPVEKRSERVKRKQTSKELPREVKHIDELPQEVLLYIFTFIQNSTKDLIRSAGVNRLWRRLCFVKEFDLPYRLMSLCKPIILGPTMGFNSIDRIICLDVRDRILAYVRNDYSFIALDIFNMSTGHGSSIKVECLHNDIVRLCDEGIAFGTHSPLNFLKIISDSEAPEIDLIALPTPLKKFEGSVTCSSYVESNIIAVAAPDASAIDVFSGHKLQAHINDTGEGNKKKCRGLFLQNNWLVAAICCCNGLFGDEHFIRTFSLENGANLVTIECEYEPMKLAADKDSRIAAAFETGEIEVFDSEDGTPLFQLDVAWEKKESSNRSVEALDMNDKWIAAALNNNRLQIWDAATGHCRKIISLLGKRSKIRHMTIEGDKLAIAEECKGHIEVWDCNKGTRLKSFCTGSSVTTLMFKNNGMDDTLLVAGTNDGRVVIWEAYAKNPQSKFWKKSMRVPLKEIIGSCKSKKQLLETVKKKPVQPADSKANLDPMVKRPKLNRPGET